MKLPGLNTHASDFLQITSSRAMGGQVIQRAILLALICFFLIYTLAEYLSTRAILTQCAAFGKDGSPWSPTTQVAVSSSDQSNRDSVDRISKQTLLNSNSTASTGPLSSIGKVTMLYGPWAEDENNQLVLKSHRQHAEKHGYSLHVLDQQTMHGMWSKLSYMLQLVLGELAKPEEDRMKWLL